jgi:hypothetical protein
MSSSTSDATTGPLLADYAPVPPASLGPSLNHEGYYIGRGERNLFWVTARGRRVARIALRVRFR